MTNLFPHLNFIKLKKYLNKMLFDTTFCLTSIFYNQQVINSFLITFFFELLHTAEEKVFIVKNMKTCIILKFFLPVYSFKNLNVILNTEVFYFLKNDFLVQLEFFVSKTPDKKFNWQTLVLFWK